MIVVNNKIVHASLKDSGDWNEQLLQEIIRNLSNSRHSNIYKSDRELSFDLTLRSYIIRASKELLASNMQFRVFRRAYCNPMFWIRTRQGGFRLRPGVRPSAGIYDIFRNGQFYATECATAIVIVFYKALLDLYGYEVFDELFNRGMYLYTWNYDPKLAIRTAEIDRPVPGDVVYIKNPQVDPITPEWQGENTVSMGSNYYYGHGIGIRPLPEIIFHLNMHRYPFAMISAYLTSLNTRIDANEMVNYLTDDSKLIPVKTREESRDVITARIGDQHQIA
ncbi:protein-glutamine gamma-glutamyltransferase [Gottfriedia solisilvae]|uniref:Protein-glutamine gamma-glutamyltransferase n=1 Tax=Gottfriedia solisilvae TaxID=1516104 RepID=A0A8J3AHF4_9BACI|nr:protein-glutamine gamma-glutamyltransferase [Gottfriedia solisilvae]GGI14532.1 protein-glutamine gamma-glutamyltransferase [Gottfriedia solisilvae]